MPVPPVVTDPFSSQFRQMVQDFNDLLVYEPQSILAIWQQHSELLNGERGVFVVDDPKYELATLPNNKDFGGTGFLRNWMAGTRLLLVQDYRSNRRFRYTAHIFCDTNFVSFCGAFLLGRPLGGNQQGFAEALEFLSPLTQSLSGLPYLVENAERRTKQQMRQALVAFAMFKTAPERFRRREHTDKETRSNAERTADGTLQMMEGGDFKHLHSWAMNQFRWSKVVLTKTALIGFDRQHKTTEEKLYQLLGFLHEELARLPQFELDVACRYFTLNSAEPFFNPIQLNASALLDSLRSMAWDLAHWRLSFDMMMIASHRESEAAFPIPHFLSFDRRFVRLTEMFRLRGLLYNAGRRRSETFYLRSFLEEVSDTLRGSCWRDFYSGSAIRDRKQRATEEAELDQKLIHLEQQLEYELAQTVKRTAN